jgi:hypothetical protein
MKKTKEINSIPPMAYEKKWNDIPLRGTRTPMGYAAEVVPCD